MPSRIRPLFGTLLSRQWRMAALLYAVLGSCPSIIRMWNTSRFGASIYGGSETVGAEADHSKKLNPEH